MSLEYPYISYRNKYTFWWGYVCDNQISAFISQDIGQQYAFVITYQQTLVTMTCDATIEVFRPCEECGRLIYCTTVQASAMATLSQVACGAKCSCQTGGPAESAPIQYFEPDYIEDDYI